MTAPGEQLLREHQAEEQHSWALYSNCEKFRYRLRREWGAGGTLCFIMLNPSTASEIKNDPTIERCQRRARALGYGAFEAVNLFALRSAAPKALYSATDPIGPANDESISLAVQASDAVLVAWGAHGAFNGRADAVRELLAGQKVYLLGKTKAGEPRHPLYVRYDAPLQSEDL